MKINFIKMNIIVIKNLTNFSVKNIRISKNILTKIKTSFTYNFWFTEEISPAKYHQHNISRNNIARNNIAGNNIAINNIAVYLYKLISKII